MLVLLVVLVVLVLLLEEEEVVAVVVAVVKEEKTDCEVERQESKEEVVGCTLAVLLISKELTTSVIHCAR